MLIVRPEITEAFVLVGLAIQVTPIMKDVDQVRIIAYNLMVDI